MPVALESYWQARSGWPPSAPAQRSEDADAIIVGAGIVGLSAALHLKWMGYRGRVEIYERNHVGFGATGRSGGLLVATDRYVPGSELDVDYLHHALQRIDAGDQLDMLDGKLLGVHNEFPNSLVDPIAVLQAIRKAFEERGGLVFENVEVVDAYAGLGTVTVVTDRGPRVSSACLLATGAYLSPALAQEIGLIIKEEACLVAEARDANVPWTFYRKLGENDFLWGRRIGDRKILIGGGATYTLPETAGPADQIRRLRQAVADYFPEIVLVDVLNVWRGRLSEFSDARGWRVLRLSPRGVFYAGGFGDCGLAAGFRAGLVAAVAIMDRIASV